MYQEKSRRRRLAIAIVFCLWVRSASAADNDFTGLEPAHDPGALEWAKRKTRKSLESLQASPVYPEVVQELSQTLNGDPPQPRISLLGNRALRFLVTKASPYGELQVAKRDTSGVPQQWRTVLNVEALREQSGVPYELAVDWPENLEDACLPPEYNRCLLRLSHAGSYEVEMREFDLQRGQFVENGFHVPQSQVMAEWIHHDLILVAQTATPGARRTISGWPAAVQLWRRGQSLHEAPVIYRAKSTDSMVVLNAAGNGTARYGVITRVIDYSTFELYLVRTDGRLDEVPVPRGSLKSMSAAVVVVAAAPEAIFVQLTRETELSGKSYPARTLLSYATDPSVPVEKRVRSVYAPGTDEFLAGPVVATDDQVAFIVNRRLIPTVRAAMRTRMGWSVRRIAKARPGEAVTALAADDEHSDIIVTTAGFTTPSRQMLYRPKAPPRLLARDPVLFDGSSYLTTIRTAASKDGTPIDYFLLKPRVSPWKRAQPVLVTGYAAFGTSFVPTYFGLSVGGPAFKLWLDRGGSLVVPAARGGGERGEEWHRAAMREHRQNSYDDFVAAIQQLIDSGYTVPSRIGVFGRSNGGLLAAVLGTQKPDLFGAIVSDVPLTDLLRMKFMGMGSLWLTEYGDPADATMAQVLERYSPLQNVRPGVRYPPFLISTSTADDVTGPGHARKLAAALQSAGAPVYFFEDTEGGHGVSDAYRNPELMGLRMTFLIDRLMGQQD
jgi:prolyl oligopeptidase